MHVPFYRHFVLQNKLPNHVFVLQVTLLGSLSVHQVSIVTKVVILIVDVKWLFRILRAFFFFL